MIEPPRRRVIARPRLWMLIGLLGATAAISLSGLLQRVDFMIYDAGLTGGPAPADVLIVAIDDKSIAQLGRWPWPRAVHAALLERLRAAGVRSVALDLLLSEPDAHSPQADAALATAMTQGPPAVLPSFAVSSPAGTLQERLPIPLLQRAAAGIGHVELEMDPDGIVRSVFLMEGPGRATRPYLALALLRATPGARPIRLTGQRHPSVAPAPGAWVRDYHVLIPFLGPPGHFRQVSYVDVLRNRVPDSTLRGKIVLVGATAQGLGDTLPTPVSGYSRPMPGVELTANVLEGLRRGTLIQPIGHIARTLLDLLPVLLAAIGLQRLPPRQALVLVLVLWVGTFAASMLALRAGWWWPPAAALATLLIAYPLWSWLRLEATQAFLDEQLAELSRERFPPLTERAAAAGESGWGDFIQRRIDLARRATERLRSAQREREDVVRFLSHDMKSPATSLLGLAQLQRDPARALPPPELSQRLDVLAQRMLTLLDSFVALARAEAADPTAFEDFDLRDAVQDACDEVWAAAQARNTTITTSLHDDACMVNGDRLLLARAIVNLLGNAVKFSPPGGTVALSCGLRDRCYVLRVADQGPGIAAQNGARLFERFSRGVHARDTDPGGAGLGLAFVRVVAEKHGGRTWAEPNAGTGAVFALAVPEAPADHRE